MAAMPGPSAPPPDRAALEAAMRRAIELSVESVASGGGPFGAVVLKDGKIIGEGQNRVTVHCDPTAHAEVVAIRNACQALGTFSLAGAVLLTSCEPCPMCLASIYWARIDRIYYGNNRDDAAGIGFDDEFLYREVALPLEQRSLPIEPLLSEEAKRGFEAWTQNPDRVEY